MTPLCIAASIDLGSIFGSGGTVDDCLSRACISVPGRTVCRTTTGSTGSRSQRNWTVIIITDTK
jgi:hypothetical protein